MRDFTLSAYRAYLGALQSSGLPCASFPEIISGERDEFVLLRHDVDRRPERSLVMAILEADLGMKATYYFRAKPCSFNAEIITEISSLGHDIGYHYECLSDTGGDTAAALDLFRRNLESFRELAPISTISMHGRPLSPYDNRDLWLSKANRALLTEMGIAGEIYHAIDYSDVAYINDTGRNWLADKANLRDHVNSDIATDFPGFEALLAYLSVPDCRKIVFQVHPERWHDNLPAWFAQVVLDSGINLAKQAITRFRG